MTRRLAFQRAVIARESPNFRGNPLFNNSQQKKKLLFKKLFILKQFILNFSLDANIK